MLTIDSIVLYVEDIQMSQKFYERLLNTVAKELSPTFVSFDLKIGSMLELKQRAQAIPHSKLTGGGTELSIAISNKEKLMEIYDVWSTNGVKFIQSPSELIFGTTFVAVDPDNHRIRVFTQ